MPARKLEANAKHFLERLWRDTDSRKQCPGRRFCVTSLNPAVNLEFGAPHRA